MSVGPPNVDIYLSDGCGRCPLGGTPECKVHTWTEELKILRGIILESELIEEIKWGVPCYTLNGKNVLLLSAFKEFCSISFFKGVLFKDEKAILVQPGKNSQAARLIKFTSAEEVIEVAPFIKAYIQEAIQIEKLGLTINYKQKDELLFPEELQIKFREDQKLKTAFEALTPGRQRGYVLYFSAPKQSKTRFSRIEKYTSKILEGKGFHDR